MPAPRPGLPRRGEWQGRPVTRSALAVFSITPRAAACGQGLRSPVTTFSPGRRASATVTCQARDAPALRRPWRARRTRRAGRGQLGGGCWESSGNDRGLGAAQVAVRTRLRLRFRRRQWPRLRLRGRYGPRLRFGFRRRQRPGFRWRCRRLRPRSGWRPRRRRRRVRRSRPWRLLRVRDRRWLHWFRPRRFRWYWLRRGGIAGYFAGGRCGRARESCWHLEMIRGRVLATRRLRLIEEACPLACGLLRILPFQASDGGIGGRG